MLEVVSGRGVADLVVAELLVVAVVVREAAVPSSPRWCWSPIAAVALVVVVAVVVAVVVREAAVPSSPRWCWSPIAAVGRVPRGRGG
ncbi:MAG TPA: hypothetical protein VHN14_10890 [Kofleriaceae bacterium]|nr:hypothetical protein [Kofleriaceae bacterium]